MDSKTHAAMLVADKYAKQAAAAELVRNSINSLFCGDYPGISKADMAILNQAQEIAARLRDARSFHAAMEYMDNLG